MVKCCDCAPSNGGTCQNCRCSKSGRPCTSSCALLRRGVCKNPSVLGGSPPGPGGPPHSVSATPAKPRVRLGRAAPVASNLPDPPSPRRWSSFSLDGSDDHSRVGPG